MLVCTFEFLLQLGSGFALMRRSLFALLDSVLNGVWLFLSGKSCFTLIWLLKHSVITTQKPSPYFLMCWIFQLLSANGPSAILLLHCIALQATFYCSFHFAN